ncbi:MAG TPA: M20/M25/M40 family metallo-hydrolase [Bryobacteraceae bacterium]|jgi:acetylornithine deacetylase|nr:M20/M25/M40 family metallo-hydrolase [Bryobacteraceae bacterium]
MNAATLEAALAAYVERGEKRLVEIIQDLVRIPSENTPPIGAEARCQRYVAEFLSKLSLEPDVYSPDDVPAIREHPLYFHGRNYVNRRNVGARKKGAGRKNGIGQARSLILSGHIDTVPQGSQSWTRDPFGGALEGNQLFGRGSNDMKGGVGTNLFVLEALAGLGLQLAGDLIFETVVDEEFGGANGTLAGRLRGFNADAAIISEPSFLRICPAQRGGRTAHILLETTQASGVVLGAGAATESVIDKLTLFLVKAKEFAAQRRGRVRMHDLYRSHLDPVPVSITKVFTGPWGPREPIGIPARCRIEMYWQTMPGETQQEVEDEFFSWLDSVVADSEGLFKERPQASFPMRWLPGSAIPRDEPVVSEFARCAASVLGQTPSITGIEGPCDLYVFQQGFGIPAILWGAKGGNTHGPDEYLEVDSVVKAAKALLLFVCRWCGVLGI